MAGKIIADTLEHSTAGSIATNYVVNGSAKAWVNFNGTGTIASRDSLNVSGLVDNAGGNYTVSYSSNMQSAGYAIASSGGDSGSYFECWLGTAYGLPTTSNTGLGTGYDTPAVADLSVVTSMIMGDLA